MTFRICSLQVGATAYYDVSTYDWENFSLQLVQDIGCEGWGPDSFTMQKKEGRWTGPTTANTRRIELLQGEIDDFFHRHAQMVVLE